MDDDQFAFFRLLVESTGPSGYETETQNIWRDRVADVVDRLETDVLGNCIATLKGDGRPRVMLDAHIDEIGCIVKYIDDCGFVYFSTIGGFDPSTMAGNRVRLLGKNGPVTGVFGRKPIHLMEVEDRKKAPELKKMWIDIGAANREEAEALLAIGDAGGRNHGMDRLQGSLVASAAMDDRVGAYIVAETTRALAGQSFAAGVYAVSSVQEEIGLRGARVSAYETQAQIGIAVEVTWTSDHPHASKQELGDIRVGSGPVLSRGANTNPRIFERLVEAARTEGIPYQVDAEAAGTPTDQNVMQMSRAGMATGLISVPTRYLHTASETLSTDDVDASVALLTRFVRDLHEGVDLTP